MLSKELKKAVSLLNRSQLIELTKSVRRRYKAIDRAEEKEACEEIGHLIKRGAIVNRGSEDYLEAVVLKKETNNTWGNILVRIQDKSAPYEKSKTYIWHREVERICNKNGTIVWSKQL